MAKKKLHLALLVERTGGEVREGSWGTWGEARRTPRSCSPRPPNSPRQLSTVSLSHYHIISFSHFLTLSFSHSSFSHFLSHTLSHTFFLTPYCLTLSFSHPTVSHFLSHTLLSHTFSHPTVSHFPLLSPFSYFLRTVGSKCYVSLVFTTSHYFVLHFLICWHFL